MPSEKLNSAIAAIKSGDKATGSRLLATILKDEPTNEIAWLWLATSIDDVEKKKFCLKKALSLNPGNFVYIKALIKLDLQPEPYFEETQPPDLTQETASENRLIFDEDKSDISAPLATPAFPYGKSTSPAKFIIRRRTNKMEKLGTILVALLISLSCVICFLIYLFPDYLLPK